MTFDPNYETGLKLLHQYIDLAHPRYNEYLTYENRLRSVNHERVLFGDTDMLRNQRHQIIYQLNQLALDLLGISFNDLNLESTLVINRRLYLDQPADIDVTLEIPFLSPQPDEGIQLEAFIPRQPEFMDIQLLQHAVANSRGVCKVLLPSFGRSGTGFLVAHTLILTSYHVLCEYADEDPATNAREVQIRFGFFDTNGQSVGNEQLLNLHPDDPIVTASPTDQLDFALLRLDEADLIRGKENYQPLRLSQINPLKRSALHILQHPSGETMKLAVGAN